MSATTDFVAAQNQNRRNTMVLLAVLTLLAGGIGYLIGALLETESSGSLPAVSQVGVAAAGLMAAGRAASVPFCKPAITLTQPGRRDFPISSAM